MTRGKYNKRALNRETVLGIEKKAEETMRENRELQKKLAEQERTIGILRASIARQKEHNKRNTSDELLRTQAELMRVTRQLGATTARKARRG